MLIYHLYSVLWSLNSIGPAVHNRRGSLAEMPLAVMTIRFSKPRTGAEILAAVQQCAGQGFYSRPAVVDDDNGVIAGQTSMYRYNQVVVMPTDEPDPNYSRLPWKNTRTVPGLSYTALAVAPASWPEPDSVYAVGYSDDGVVEAVRGFRDKVKQALSE